MADGKEELRHVRTPLTAPEILELGGCLADVFRMLREMRERNSVTAHIKNPPLPPVFSESIVIVATPTPFGSGYKARFGGKVCDVVLISDDAKTEKRVEVKATGRHAFQELKEKDLLADILVWIRFGEYFEAGSGAIQVAVLEKPAKYIATPRRLDFHRFEEIPGVTEAQELFNFTSLSLLVGGHGRAAARRTRSGSIKP